MSPDFSFKLLVSDAKTSKENRTMSQWDGIANFILLPELKLINRWNPSRFRTFYKAQKESLFEVCPKCATPCRSVHDRRWVKIQDQPIRGSGVYLRVLKRRFRCHGCKKVFTEPLHGVRKGFRTTERYRRGVKWACENFSDLKGVQRAFGCSSWLVYKIFYEQLAIKARERQYPWPSTIGIDEHSFKRNRRLGVTEFASIIVDYKNHRIFEVVEGKTANKMTHDLDHIPGKTNVKNVVVDLCDPFKKFARDNFPHAEIIADKFHVLRLLNPAINVRRKEITGDQRSNPVRKLLLRNGSRLEYFERRALHQWLDQNPVVREVYYFKEALHRFYRTKGYNRASRVLTKLTDSMALSKLKEITTLRKTLMKWRKEILAYFKTGLTNGKTEGYNRLAKLYQYRAFGYKSFKNYRLRLLNA
jgi:transposase